MKGKETSFFNKFCARLTSDGMFGTERMTGALNNDPDAAPELILKNIRSSVEKPQITGGNI